MTVRAKFRCNSVQTFANGQRNYAFSAMHDTSTPENARFTRYTPSGALNFTVDNPAVEFTPGEDYYLDFTPAAQ